VMSCADDGLEPGTRVGAVVAMIGCGRRGTGSPREGSVEVAAEVGARAMERGVVALAAVGAVELALPLRDISVEERSGQLTAGTGGGEAHGGAAMAARSVTASKLPVGAVSDGGSATTRANMCTCFAVGTPL
jgi:hypothetical protein